MEDKHPININKLLKNILAIAIAALIVFLLWYFLSITIYIAAGLVLTLIARPLYLQLERIKIKNFKFPSGVNALLSILLIWGVLGGIGAIVFPLMISEGVKISKIDPDRFISQMEKPINQTVHQLESIGVLTFAKKDSVAKPEVKTLERIIVYKLPCDSVYNAVYNKGNIFEPDADTIVKTVKNPEQVDSVAAPKGIQHRDELEVMARGWLSSFFNVEEMQLIFGSALNFVGNFLATIVSASFLAFFFLKDKNLLRNIILSILPKKHEPKVIAVMEESRKVLSRYFIGLILELLGVMILTTIGLLIIGLNLQMAVTIGFLAGLFNIVPYVGPIIGGVVGIFIGITNYLEMDLYTVILPLVGKMVIVSAVVQIIDNNILQTVIFSNSVKAHPIEIFLVIVVAGSLAGIGGMICAVPLYSVLRVIAKNFFSHFRFIKSLTQNT